MEGRRMPRVSRMPDLYHDKTKGRYFVEKRVPKDVLAIIGGKTKRKQTLPQSVDYATAVRLTRDIVSAWEKEWDAARPHATVAGFHQGQSLPPTEGNAPDPG